MLWFKGWLELRYRLVSIFIVTTIMLYMQHSAPQNAQSMSIGSGLLYFMAIITFMISAIMAGAGIVTQSLYPTTRGIHGSMQYTLALPVSRLRILLVRAGMGWLGAAGATGLLCYAVWILYPQLRTTGTFAMAEHVGTLIGCASTIYFLSVLLATFLDDQGRALGSMFAVFVVWWLSIRGWIPVSIDIVRAMSKGSPLVTHVMPWTPLGFSLGLSVVLFLAALQVARVREY